MGNRSSNVMMNYILLAQVHNPQTRVSELIPVQEEVKTKERENEIKVELIKQFGDVEIYWVWSESPDLPISLSSCLSN